MDLLAALVGFIHLLATVVWIGGVVFVMLVFAPVLGRHKELGPAAGMLSLEVSKRFMVLVWASIILFIVTGIPMTVLDPQYFGLLDMTNPWAVAITVKHILYGVMVVCAAAATFTIRGMSRLLMSAEAGPSAERRTPGEMPPEMAKLGRRQMVIGVTVFVLGILVLLLTAIAEAA